MAKRQKLAERQIFLVPESDGKASVGQLLRITAQALNSVLCAYYDLRRDPSSPVAPDELVADKLIAILFTAPDLLKNGTWPVVGIAEPRHLALRRDFEALERARWVGTKINGSGIVREFLEAFHRLRPWDDWANPNYLDTLLISPDRKPRDVVLKNG